jgi:hypothetical protein
LLEIVHGREPSNDQISAAEAFLPKLSETLEDYFKNAHEEFQSTVVHEFGHVLGLPHVHQSPLARPRWRSLYDLLFLVQYGTGVRLIWEEGDGVTEEQAARERQIATEFVRSQILLPWPSTRSEHGNVLFSDWQVPKFDRDGDPKLDSVMNHPLWRFLLVDKLDPKRPPKRVIEPTQIDNHLLGAMYRAV